MKLKIYLKNKKDKQVWIMLNLIWLVLGMSTGLNKWITFFFVYYSSIACIIIVLLSLLWP